MVESEEEEEGNDDDDDDDDEDEVGCDVVGGEMKGCSFIAMCLKWMNKRKMIVDGTGWKRRSG